MAPHPPHADPGGVPTNLPFVVRPRHRRIVVPFALLLLCCGLTPYGAFAALLTTSLRGDAASAMALGGLLTAAGLLCIVLPVAALGFVWWRVLAYGGAYLAAGPDGLWIRRRTWARPAVWLSWQDIDRVEIGGYAIGQNATVHSGRDQYAFLLLAADQNASDILAALTALAAGRTTITHR